MHGLDFVQSFEAIEDLFKKICGLLFFQSLFLFQILLNVPLIAELHYNKHMLVWHERINVFDDVIVFARFKDFDLSLDKFLEFRFFLHLLKGDGFDGNSLFIDRIVAFIDDGAGTITKFLDDRVGFEFFSD